MSGNYSNVFGGSTVKPSQVSFLNLSLSADTTLAWPTEAQESDTYVASQINVTATAASLTLTMPPANQGSTGPATQITNIGTNSFQVLDNTGVQIVNITAGLTWQISLTDNTTVAGQWQAIQIGATTSSAQASALADNLTIQATGTKLQTFIRSATLSDNTTIDSTYRGEGIIWNGAVAGKTLTLDSIANLTAGWHALITNQGTASVTLATTGGETIDGVPTFVLPPGFSLIIVCAASGFTTFCNTPNPLGVSYGGTGATTPNQALINLGASTIGLNIFTAPSASAVIALLGLTQTSLTESSVATNQVLNSASTQTAFVCTAALTLTLPLTTGLTKSFIFASYAQGGAVTITPNVADKINGGVAGASYTLAQGASIMMTTDANGNWWPLFLNPGVGTGTVTSVGLTAPSIFVVTNAPITTSGSINLALANGSVNAVFAGPASGGAATPTFRPLVSADFPANTIANSSLQQMAANTLKGNNTAGTANAADLTVAQVLAMLGSVSGFTSIATQFLSATGTYTPTSGMKYCIVFATGAGGGGAGSAGTASGGGGGAGATAINIFSAATIGANQAVTINAAGVGGTAGAPTSGTAGGSTTFGALLTAGGGSGAPAINSGETPGAGAAGGTASGGIMNIPGGAGTAGGTSNGMGVAGTGGTGGIPLWGGGATGGFNGSAGNTATVYGAGGGGPSGPGNGGNGLTGCVLVFDFVQ